MYRFTLASVASSVFVITSSSSPVFRESTSVCRSPSERATIRSVTRLTGWEMDRAKRRIINMETARPARVAKTDTVIAQLIKWL